MIKLFIDIKIHSVVDLITNSSTEMFLIGGKSEEEVEKLLRYMVEEWNKLAAAGVFGEYLTCNKRRVLNGEITPVVMRFEDMFEPIYVYTKEQLEEDERRGNCWGYERDDNVGRIVITSKSDNSIPYQMMQWIETAFNDVISYRM